MLEIFTLIELLKNITQPANILNFNLQNSQKESVPIYKEIKSLKIDKSLISAKNVLIKEIEGEELFEKNSKEIKPIASITKLLSAVIALENYKENDSFTISKEILNYNGENGGFVEGEVFKRDDLIKAMLVGSSNRAVYALAYKMGIENFVNKMNEKVKEIGMNETTIVDPSGLNNNNRSSLNDLYLLSKYILKNYPEIFKFSILPYFDIKGSYFRRIYNLNYLIPYYGKYILGSKTGFTDEAGECLIMLIKFKNSPIVFLGLLDSKDRLKDAEFLLLKLKKYYGE
jgi:D-alanyl-D-alanine carboxypeptidase